jgi:hypothetical protein
MKTIAGLFATPVILCAIASCGETPPPDAVIIVDGSQVTFHGTLTPQDEEGDFVSFDVAVPGNLVIFRTDGTFGTDPQAGEAGQVYRIRDDGTLDPIGSVDLAKSDEELVRQYGVEPGSSVQLPR